MANGIADKSLMSANTSYSNVKREVLSISHGLEKIHYYIFSYEVSINTDHKTLVGIFKKVLQACNTVSKYPASNTPIQHQNII